MRRRESEDFRVSAFDKMIGRDEEGGKISQGVSDLLFDMKENGGRYKLMFITGPLAGIIISSWIVQLVLKLFEKQDKIYISKLFTAWFNIPGAILAAIVCFIWISVIFRFNKINKKDYYMDRENNVMVSKQGIHGTAHWQTEKEREQCFKRSKNIDDLFGDILGIDDNKRLYTLRDDLVGINRNKCIFGTPGSGKSAAIIENDIMQCIRREESAIITDSKGDLYRRLSQLARDNGYCVRVLNLKSNELKN